MPSYAVSLESAQVHCKSNHIGLSKIYVYLTKNNHSVVNNASDAEYIIINTCGFREDKENSSIKIINEHIRNDHAKVISFGCLNNINKELIRSLEDSAIVLDKESDLDEIFFQNVKYNDVKESYLIREIGSLINFEKPVKEKNRDSSIIYRRSKIYNDSINEKLGKNKFYVEICRGCVGSCSYCIIKKARGNGVVSRDPKEIIRDIRIAGQPGQSLCLVADDCGSYGVDSGSDLPALLKEISNNFPDIAIEICYLNPLWLKRRKEDYLDAFQHINIKSINIPLQSGSDKIVRRMNRKYKVKDILNTVKKIREASPTTFIWSHAIIGFPGENIFDYIKTLRMLCHFDMNYLFAYSKREGTKSATFNDKKSNFVVKARHQCAILFNKFNYFTKIMMSLIFRRQ